jgi:hypothetical protein
MIGLWFLCQVLNFFGWDLWIDGSYVLAGLLLIAGFICGTVAVVVNSKDRTPKTKDLVPTCKAVLSVLSSAQGGLVVCSEHDWMV